MSSRNYSIPTKRYKSLISASHSVYRLINTTYQLNDFVSRLSRLYCQIFNARSCLVALVNGNKTDCILKSLISDRKKYLIDKKTRITNPSEKKIVEKLCTTVKPRYIGKPLIADDVIGYVILQRKERSADFTEFDRDMLNAVCEQAVIGIKNLQLFEEQQKILLGSIKSLAKFLDTRVPQEYAHSPNFPKLVTLIGIEMQLDEKQLETLRFACLLHDAGKVDIPLGILQKRTKLTAKEYSIVKNHPLKSVQILRPLQGLKPVIPIITHHHERYNGTGYPSRLKKGQIPLGARIMAVADAFEAMVYGRPYKERIGIPEALKEIKKKSGTQFDPKVVDAFLQVIKKFKSRKYL
ncbi:MAG: HD domain-containing protein [Candidatus Omnitrophica bacterium]|nr:HD domain-containing protein [Candidatus Omnitrophota bacterium]